MVPIRKIIQGIGIILFPILSFAQQPYVYDSYGRASSQIYTVADTTELKYLDGEVNTAVYLKQLSSSDATGGGIFVLQSSSATADMIDVFSSRFTTHRWLRKTYQFWDDLRFPATLQRQGATTKPDYDYTNMGLLFPQNDSAEVSYIIGQLPHTWKEGTDLEFHVHFIRTTDSLAKFRVQYRWYNVGDDIASLAFTTLQDDHTTNQDWSASEEVHTIVGFPSVSGTGKTISSILEIKLKRWDNIVTGDVTVKEFDIHYKLDAPGSSQEYIKQRR